MKGVSCILLIVLAAGCESDPPMTRKDGYTPGSYHERYKSIVNARRSDPLRNTADNHTRP